MSMFGNLTASYIRKAIEKEILEAEAAYERGDIEDSGYIDGLERAKNIAAQYED